MLTHPFSMILQERDIYQARELIDILYFFVTVFGHFHFRALTFDYAVPLSPHG